MLFVEEDYVCGKNGVRGPQLQDVVILGGGKWGRSWRQRWSLLGIYNFYLFGVCVVCMCVRVCTCTCVCMCSCL